MAGTYSFQQIVQIVSEEVPKMYGVDKQYVAANMALSRVWTEGDWRESLAEIPPFFMIPYQQDYGAPAISVPTDFLGLRQAYYIDISSGSSGKAFEKELLCISKVADTYRASVDGNIESIGYYEPTQTFRLHPVPITGAPFRMVGKILYKKKPYAVSQGTGAIITKVTSGNIADALIPFGDNYISCWVQAVKWAFAMILSKNVQEEYAILMEELEKMAETEALELGNPVQKPLNSFVSRAFGAWW